jgi:acetyl esterase
MRTLLTLSISIALSCCAPAESLVPKPTVSNVSYGPHSRNVLDFWQAKSESPAPVVVFIHGGGFRAGSKENWSKDARVAQLLSKGVSCAAINYRFLPDAPVQDIMRDCARAVQFLRSKASEWHIDKAHFAGIGGSAGAGTSLWLLAHDDLADATASDPVLHESSRLCCAVLLSTQATYDLRKWEAFLGKVRPEFQTGPVETAGFYHFTGPQALETPEGDQVMRDCDMLRWLSKDDGALFIDNGQDVFPPKTRGEWLHCTAHARAVKKQCEACGVECLVVQDEKTKKHDACDFLAKHLGLN